MNRRVVRIALWSAGILLLLGVAAAVFWNVHKGAALGADLPSADELKAHLDGKTLQKGVDAGNTAPATAGGILVKKEGVSRLKLEHMAGGGPGGSKSALLQFIAEVAGDERYVVSGVLSHKMLDGERVFFGFSVREIMRQGGGKERGTADQREKGRPAGSPLLQARMDTARQGFLAVDEEFRAGKCTWEPVAAWSERWLQAQLGLIDSKGNHQLAHEEHLARLKKLEDDVNARHKAGQAPVQDMLAARFERQGAELAMAGAKMALNDRGGVRTTVHSYRDPEPVAPLPMPSPAPAPKTTATIVVRLPATAKLLLDGIPASHKGDYRRLVIEDLEPSLEYGFDLRATWVENGQEIAPPGRHISFQAGDLREVDFTLPPPEPVPPAPMPSKLTP